MIDFSKIQMKTALPIIEKRGKELFSTLYHVIDSNHVLLKENWINSSTLNKVSAHFPTKNFMFFFKSVLVNNYDENYIKNQLNLINKFDISVENYLEVYDILKKVILPIIKEKISNKEDYFLLQESLNRIMFLDLKIISKRNILVSSLKDNSLNGLMDVQGFLGTLNKKISTMKENQNLVVIVFDIQKFTKIREVFGYSQSDLILVKIKDIIFAISQKYFDKENIFLSRTGFDEFSIAIATNNLNILDIYMKKINSEFSEPIFMEGNELYINLAKGGAIYPQNSKNPDELLKFAKISLSASKKQRNKFVKYSKSFTNDLKDIFNLETSIRKAIKKQEFKLYYQPKIDFKTNKISGVEALVRWNHPTKGIIAPKEFLPFLEESELIIEVGKWIFKEACEQVSSWKSQGIFLKIAINISQLQLVQDDFIDFIEETIISTKITPDDIELELTESFLISLDENIKKLERIKEMGISMSIDDFGTGYSSLSYLENLPVSKIKIDLTFVKNLNSLVNRNITETIINLANKLNLKTVSEGIETIEQLEVLKTLNCDEGQGYYFSKPICPKEMKAIYQKYS